MKRFTITFSLITLIAVLTAFSNPGDWQLFESTDFQAFYPNLPSSQVKTVNSAVGELKMNIFMYDASNNEKDENLVYGIITTEYPDSIINSSNTEVLQNFFRNSIDGAVNNVNGKLISESTIDIDGFPGREIKVNFRDGLAVIKMRMYLVNNKIFTLQTITKTENDLNKSIDKFMNSFKLK